MNTKDKLSSNSIHILKINSDDEQIMFNHMDYKRDHKDMNPKAKVTNRACHRYTMGTNFLTHTHTCE